MATYADFVSQMLSSYTPRERARHKPVDYSQGVQFAVSTILQKREAEKQRKAAEEAAKRKAEMDRARFEQGQREFFTKSLQDVQSDLASGDADRIQRAETILRSAGGQVEGAAPAGPLDSIGRRPAPRAEAERAPEEPPSTPAGDVVREAKRSLGPLSDLESLASLRGEEEAPVGGGGVLSLEPMTVTAGEGAPQEGEPLLPDVQIEGHLGVTQGMPQKIPLMPGAAPEVLIQQPAPDLESVDPSKAAEVNEESPVVGYSETEEGELVPLRLADEPMLEQTTKRVLDPFGNEVGTINVGGTDALVDRAMQSLRPTIEAWADTLPDAPVEALENMARERVRAVLSSYDGNLKDGLEMADKQIDSIFETLHKNMRAEMNAEAMGALGIGAANKYTELKAGKDFVKNMAQEKGYDELAKMNEELTNSVNATEEMLRDISEGRPVNTAKFGQILFTMARANDKGRLSDQDFARSVGESSIVETLKSWVAGKLSITEAKYDIGQVLKTATVPAMKVRRIQRHLMGELLRTKKKQQAAQADAAALYQEYVDMGALGVANGVASTANRLFGAGLPIISQQEAMRRAQITAQAAQQQQVINQQHRQRVEQEAQTATGDPVDVMDNVLQGLGH